MWAGDWPAYLQAFLRKVGDLFWTMGDPPSDPESPYQQSSRRSQPQPLVPEEVVDAQNLRSNQEMPTSRTNLWGMPQGASRTQPGDHMMFQPEAPQLGGREYPAFPSEFQQRTYLDEVGLQATHDAGLMLQQLQQDQGDLFQPLEAAYPEPQPDFLDPFNMYPREDLQFIQDTQHGPYIRDEPSTDLPSCKRDQRRNRGVRLWSWEDQWKVRGFYSEGDEEAVEYFERGGT